MGAETDSTASRTGIDRDTSGRFQPGNRAAVGRATPAGRRARVALVRREHLERAIGEFVAQLDSEKAIDRAAAAMALVKIVGCPLPADFVDLDPPESDFDAAGRLTADEQATLRALILKAKGQS